MSAYLALTEDNYLAIVPERQLWQAVVNQAVIEALLDKPSQLRQDARDWIFSSPYTFEKACEFAGWNPDYVRAKTRCRIEADKLFRHAPRQPRRDTKELDDLRALQ
jgi:hypothetical protein